MTDPANPTDPAPDADSPIELTGPLVDAGDDAFVAALLAASGAQVGPVPAEVAARWDQALADEARQAVVESGIASGTVVPLDRAASRRGRSVRGMRAVTAIAGVAAAALVGAVVVNAVASDPSTVITDASSALPTAEGVTTSGRTFTDANVTAAATDLVANEMARTGIEAADAEASGEPLSAPTGAPTTVDSGATAVPALAQRTWVKAFIADEARRTACITNLAQKEGVRAVAVDVGYYKGEPAVMVVLPTEAVAVQIDVFIVGPKCDLVEADVLYFARIDVSDSALTP